jgi:hypothetical protein
MQRGDRRGDRLDQPRVGRGARPLHLFHDVEAYDRADFFTPYPCIFLARKL